MFRSLSQVRHISTGVRLSKRLDGKVAVLTASTDGIGLAMAHRLGKDGAHVVVSSRKQENVDKAIAKLQEEKVMVSGYVCHAGKAEDRRRLLDEVKKVHGGFDIFIANAGINPHFGPTLKTPELAYDKMFDLNVKSTFQWIQDSVPLMESRPNSSIVLLSSIAAFAAYELLGIYSVSKAALVSLTKVLTPELAAKKIRINCIAPGLITTKFSTTLWEDPVTESAASETLLRDVPLKRKGTPEECTGIVSLLCSDEGTYITGETIVVAGGMKSRM